MVQDKNEHYDLDDPKVISVIDDLPLWSAPFGLKLLDTIRYKKNITALDIGSGTGFPLIEVAMRLGNTCALYGVDIWSKALERVEEKIKTIGISNITMQEASAEYLPFQDNTFDLIFSNNGINNVEDMEKVIDECHRTCKPQGQFVFTVNLEDTMIEFYDVFRQVLKDNHLDDYVLAVNEHIREKRKPLNVIENLLTRSGFKIHHIETDSFYMKYTDGTSFFEHFLIEIAFKPSWEKIIPEKDVPPIFAETEKRLNEAAGEKNELNLTVPFVTIDCVNT